MARRRLGPSSRRQVSVVRRADLEATEAVASEKSGRAMTVTPRRVRGGIERALFRVCSVQF